MKVYSENRTVYDELYSRLKGVFDKNERVYLGFSGGKDSLVVAHAVMELIQQGKIDPKKLIVVFVDEEAIYPCVEQITLKWRKKFLMVGAKFLWLCMEFKHYNCFNMLSNDESFILWDSTKKDVWIRPMPDFAITSHPKFKKGQTYQDFLNKIKDGPFIIATRASESVQRLTAFMNSGGKTGLKYFPIYDWSLNDIWLYIYNKKIELPDAYLYMWKLGIPVTQLRISQFFSIDTAANLVRMVEFYPELYQKVLNREPNAYLAMYYWDSEMFRRSTKKRQKLEGTEQIDWKEKFFEKYRSYEDKSRIEYKRVSFFLMKHGKVINEKMYKRLFDVLEAGDPKLRTMRSIYTMISEVISNTGGKK